MVPPKPEPIQIKDDPDPKVLPVTNGRYLGPFNVKKEEPDDGKVDATLQDAGQSDMFEDVDGPEVVDLTYEGIAEIDGVDHFVCEGSLTSLLLCNYSLNHAKTSRSPKFPSP